MVRRGFGSLFGFGALTADELEVLRAATRAAATQGDQYLEYLDAATQILVHRRLWDEAQRADYLQLTPWGRVKAWASGEILAPIEQALGEAAGKVRDPFGVSAFTAGEIEELRRCVALARQHGAGAVATCDNATAILVRRGVWTPGKQQVYLSQAAPVRAAMWASGEITDSLFQVLQQAEDAVDAAIPPPPTLPSFGVWPWVVLGLLLMVRR